MRPCVALNVTHACGIVNTSMCLPVSLTVSHSGTMFGCTLTMFVLAHCRQVKSEAAYYTDKKEYVAEL
jgi:heme A synthase